MHRHLTRSEKVPLRSVRLYHCYYYSYVNGDNETDAAHQTLGAERTAGVAGLGPGPAPQPAAVLLAPSLWLTQCCCQVLADR